MADCPPNSPPLVDLDDLIARLAPGMMLAVPPDYSGVAMAATFAIARAGPGDLHLVACPTSGIQADVLIGAGRVAVIEAAAVTLGEFGAAPRFTEAVIEGRIAILDATCPAIHAGLQAAEKGVPFIPLRGIIGSDLLRYRDDWRVIDNPFAADEPGDPIVVLPAITPDIALFHAPFADRAGNVWVGRRRELTTLAHAARATLVTVEEIRDGDLLADETLAAGAIPSLYITAIAECARGAWPLGLAGCYEADAETLADYARGARDEAGFRRFLAEHGAPRAAA